MNMKKLLLGCFAGAVLLFSGSMVYAEDNDDDRDEIAELTEKAKSGDAEAQNNLGVHYGNGDGVKQDKVKAFKLFQKSAAQNYPDGVFNLAVCYYEGEGVNKDLPKAINLLKKAVKLDSYAAYSLLGACYLSGIGVKKDVDEGFDLTKVAAENGIPQAQHNMGYCFEKGIAVEEVDLEEAKKWYQKAAKAKYEPAIKALKELKAATGAKNGGKEETAAGADNDEEDGQEAKPESKPEIKIFTDKKELPKGLEKIGSAEISHSGGSISIGQKSEEKRESLRDEILKKARKQGAAAILILKESGDTGNGYISAEFYK